MSRAWDTLYSRHLKRWADIVVSTVALLLLSPLLALIAFAVRISSGSPILFRQVRTGLGETPFEICKFRTMTDQRGLDGELLPDRHRLTRLGKFLRETSLDELPGLVNVLRGEMSLVGPRPLPHHYLQHYSNEQRRRHDVRPGITGWVAVNGRNTTTWRQRFELDLFYVDNLSALLDLRIVLRTLATVLSRKDVNPTFADQMPEFRGPED